MKNKKALTNIYLVILIVIVLGVIIYYGYGKTGSLNDVIVKTAYSNFEYTDGLIKYTSVYNNQKSGFTDTHFLYNADYEAVHDLANKQAKLNKNDYVCRVKGTINLICSGGTTIDPSKPRCVGINYNYDIQGEILDLLHEDNYKLWACKVNKDPDLMFKLPLTFVNPSNPSYTQYTSLAGILDSTVIFTKVSSGSSGTISGSTSSGTSTTTGTSSGLSTVSGSGSSSTNTNSNVQTSTNSNANATTSQTKSGFLYSIINWFQNLLKKIGVN